MTQNQASNAVQDISTAQFYVYFRIAPGPPGILFKAKCINLKYLKLANKAYAGDRNDTESGI